MSETPSPGETKSASAEAGELFRLELKGEEVHLTVFPPKDDGSHATAQLVLEECGRRGFDLIKQDLVQKAVAQAKGVSVFVGARKGRDAEADIFVSKDGMQAWMTLHPPEPGGAPITRELLVQRLRDAGVVFGLKDNEVTRLGETPEFGAKVLIAEGRPVVHGENARIEYFFETEKHAKPRVVDETGKVDFKELNLVQNVVAGQILAVKHPPTPGQAGVTVENEYVPAKPGKDVPFGAGKNVEITEDGKEAKATVNGVPMLLASKVLVSQIYTVQGSVDSSTGNVNFVGTVEITGGVEDGFSVKASENIHVAKTVGNAILEAGSNIVIGGGMLGHNEGKLSAGGNIRVKFLQETNANAKGDIIVGEAVLHSHLSAGGRILVGIGGKKGQIVGGQIRALTLVACKTLGSPMSTKTLVDVGVDPKMLERSEHLQAEIAKDRKSFDNVRKGLAALQAVKEKTGGLPEEKENILRTLHVAAGSLKAKLQELAAEMKEIQEQLSKEIRAKVSVEDTLFPGVKISFGSLPFYVTTQEKFVTLHEEGGEVRSVTYEAPEIGKK